MSSKLFVLAALLATCCAKPYFYSVFPDVAYLREARAPSIGYGFGSGYAADIAGVKNSNSIGVSFQTGDAQAYGSGTGSTDGNIFANGVGYANANPIPTPLAYRSAPVPYSAYPYSAPYYTYPYNVGYNNYRTPIRNFYNAPAAAVPTESQNIGSQLRDSYGNSIALAQNTGNLGNSIAQSQNSPFGSTASAINVNNRNAFGNLGGSVISYAVSTPTGSNSKSFVQSYDEDGGLTGALAASEDDNGAKGSTSQTFQQKGSEVMNSGATAIDGPGIQASHSHSNNNANKNGARTFY